MSNTDSDQQDKKTVLYDQHKKLGGKIVPFGGWLMPVSYTSVMDEHKCVRENVGLFDVSHMGEIFISGDNALGFLQSITINDAAKLGVGGGQYTAMCNEKGGMVDDLILYRIEEKKFLLCVNASNTDKDFDWIVRSAKEWTDLVIENQSDLWSQIAVQGPTCDKALEGLISADEIAATLDLPYTHIREITLFGANAYIARTGYTGEKGYELYLPNDITEKTWTALLGTKQESNIMPIGLGARDTLRLEACYLLYGNDMNDTVSPLEAGIAWATKLDAKDFTGKEVLVAQKAAGVERRIYAFKFEDKGIPRHGMKVYLGNEELGEVTSGSVLPTLGGSGGMALIATGKVKVGDTVEINVRGKRKVAKIMKRPLYKAKVK